MTHPALNASTLEIAKALISRQSITPIDAGCQAYMAEYLSLLGFETEHMDFADTQNIWSIRHATKMKKGSPCFVFAGHTDVVPPGNLDNWDTPPFDPIVKNNILYGRGAADMKGSLAAMLTATRQFVEQHPEHNGSIAFLITSDEEGPFINGTVKVVDELIKRKQNIDYCIVGEPSSSNELGDVIKIGRRGSLTCWLTFKGKQGHVAYPHLAENALHMACSFINHISQIEWDKGNQFFPATSLQVTNITSGEAGNVIPGEAHIEFNFRFSTEQHYSDLQSKVEKLISNYASSFEIRWKLNGEPFLTESHQLVEATTAAIRQTCNIETVPETTGGTSDGRFIAKTEAQIVELGRLINLFIKSMNA